MTSNPLLKRLGLTSHDRVAILHADDVGMCQASLTAFADLREFGLVKCGAVMVPCPWSNGAGAYASAHPGTDLGVHLTLTSEWGNYRWGPISTRDRRSGLLDADGFFPAANRDVQESADPRAAALEMEAQVERALQMGIEVSHIDTHMGTVLHPKFIETYISLALKKGIPAMIFRWGVEQLVARGLDAASAEVAAGAIHQLEESGFPLLDHLHGMPLDQPDQRLEQVKAALDALKPGITHFIIHPAADTPEVRAITKDWQSRVADYQTFLREDLLAYIRESGIVLLGYRDLLQLVRSS